MSTSLIDLCKTAACIFDIQRKPQTLKRFALWAKDAVQPASRFRCAQLLPTPGLAMLLLVSEAASLLGFSCRTGLVIIASPSAGSAVQ